MATFHAPNFAGNDRAIAVALIVSSALHLVVLLILPSLREAYQRRSEAEPILARLVEPAPRSVATPTPPVEPIRPRAPEVQALKQATPESAPKLSQPRRTTAPAPVTPRAEISTPVPAKSEPAGLEPPQPSAGAPTPGTAPSASIAMPVPRAAPPPAEFDAGTLAQYRLSLISAARRFKRYPRVAVDQNWQGNVEVRMVIAANGEISALLVRSSAGHHVLDQHALEMIERAKAMAPIPPALRGKEFTVDVPIVFSLREAGG
jgi:periplasmic protein TonB